MNKLKCVKICNERFIADMIQSYLKMHDIESIIKSDSIGQIFLGNLSTKGFRIMVRDEDEQKAKEVLEKSDFEIDPASNSE